MGLVPRPTLLSYLPLSWVEKGCFFLKSRTWT